MVQEKEDVNKKAMEAENHIEEEPLNKEEPQSIQIKTFTEKLIHIKDNITVEPMLAGLIIPSVISKFAMANLNLDKACRVNLNFTDEICDSLLRRDNNFTSYEREVQKLISSIDIWKGVINTLIPCIIIMFIGAWSDRTGKRKLCILMPICGEVAVSISNIICVFFFYEIPVEMTVFLETIIPACTGGWMTMFLGVFAYITDITKEEERTFRVGLVNFCMTLGMPIGFSLGGIILRICGYYMVFFTTGLLLFLVMLYGIFILKEPKQILIEKGWPVPVQPDNTGVSFLDLSHVAATLAVAFRPRSGIRRLKVLLTLFVVFILFGPSMSEHTIFYLFVRNQLNWDLVKYSLFISYSVILHSFGAMFSITLLSRKLQVEDSMLCLISCISKFIGSIWTAFVKTDLEMYIMPVVEILNATTFTSLRSIVSKLVDKQENAKVNSLFSLTETLASLVFNPFYSWTYMKTLQVLPGAVFLISAALIVPAFVILIMFYVQTKIENRNTRRIALEAEERQSAALDKKKEKKAS